MASLELVVDPETIARFPDVEVAAFAATGLGSARDELAGAVEPLLADATDAVRREFTAENVARDERVDAWRQAIRACGLSASDVRSSPEQLVRRLLRDAALGVEDPLVAAYCAVSAKHVAPLGAYDLDRLPATTIALRPAQPTDSFEPLGAPARDMPLEPRVIVYAADAEVLCWAFNHRDSARTALRDDTERALFVGEALFPPHHAALSAAIGDLRELLASRGATVGDAVVASAGGPRQTVPLP